MFISPAKKIVQEDYRQQQSLLKALNFIDHRLRVGKIFYVRDSNNVCQSSNVLSPLARSSTVEMSDLGKDTSSSNYSTSSKTTLPSTAHTTDKEYEIEVEGLMPSLCVDITLLLTFGLASPLLALIISCSIIVNIMLWRLAIGRYVKIVTTAMGSRACLSKLERAFDDEWRCLPRSWKLMSVFIGMFWGLFVNDMIGDKDPKGGIVAGSCMVIWCPCLFISLQLLLSVDPDTSDAIFFHYIRSGIHDFSSRLHFIIWKYVFRLDCTGSIKEVNSSSSTHINNETMSSL